MMKNENPIKKVYELRQEKNLESLEILKNKYKLLILKEVDLTEKLKLVLIFNDLFPEYKAELSQEYDNLKKELINKSLNLYLEKELKIMLKINQKNEGWKVYFSENTSEKEKDILENIMYNDYYNEKKTLLRSESREGNYYIYFSFDEDKKDLGQRPYRDVVAFLFDKKLLKEEEERLFSMLKDIKKMFLETDLLENEKYFLKYLSNETLEKEIKESSNFEIVKNKKNLCLLIFPLIISLILNLFLLTKETKISENISYKNELVKYIGKNPTWENLRKFEEKVYSEKILNILYEKRIKEEIIKKDLNQENKIDIKNIDKLDKITININNTKQVKMKIPTRFNFEDLKEEVDFGTLSKKNIYYKIIKLVLKAENLKDYNKIKNKVSLSEERLKLEEIKRYKLEAKRYFYKNPKVYILIKGVLTEAYKLRELKEEKKIYELIIEEN